MNAILDEHDLRGAVERMAAGATTPPLPGTAILAAGARRRTRRRLGAVGSLALAATLAVSVSWSAFSGGSSPDPAGPGAAPTTTNAFTDQIEHTLEQVLPGTKVSAAMFTDLNPAARHQRDDVFPLRITYRGHVLDAFLTLQVWDHTPDYPASALCHDSLPWNTTRSDCVAKDLAGGGILHAELAKGPAAWTARSAGRGLGDKTLTIIDGDVSHGSTWALLQIRAGARANDSGLTPAKVSAAMEDPRFTAFLNDFTAHPERDPYGPLARISKKIVTSGPLGTHTWTLSFAIISQYLDNDGDPKVNDNCDYWELAIDGKTVGSLPGAACQMDGSTVHNPPPTDEGQPFPANPIPVTKDLGLPGDVGGTILTSTVPAGTATVEATFDDQSAPLTGKVFTVHGDIPYFALVKPGAQPAWKKAKVRCLDATGKEVAKLYFATPAALDPSAK
ncbi:hypothetical protein [Catenulispora subtropica]|uniref:Uncharacterized protein n=1 Tax=Catenulispora subtropica TaxID=450798 RepID=A0ABP5CH66_9ACTN